MVPWDELGIDVYFDWLCPALIRGCTGMLSPHKRLQIADLAHI